MAVEADVDVDLLKSEIRRTYASVSQEPGKDFIFRQAGRGPRISATRRSSRGYRRGSPAPQAEPRPLLLRKLRSANVALRREPERTRVCSGDANARLSRLGATPAPVTTDLP